MITSAMCSSIVGYLLASARVKSVENATQKVKPYTIKRDNKGLRNLISGIDSTMNPFDEERNDGRLYCLSMGKAVFDKVKDDLTNCSEIGQKWCYEFKDECYADPVRAEKLIPHRKVKNFSCEAITMKMQGKDMKLRELQGTRNLFGRHLYLSTDLLIKQDLLSEYLSFHTVR